MKTYLNLFEVLTPDSRYELPNGTPFMQWPKPEKKFFKRLAVRPTKKSSEMNADELEEELSSQQQHQQAQLNSNDSSMDTSFMNDSSSSQKQLGETLDSSFSSSQNHMSIEGKKDKKQHSEGGEGRKHVMRNLPRTKGSIKKRLRPLNVPRSNVERRRRVRCHKCEPCTRDDCGECKYCKDMKKFGGTGVSKQCCLSKQCLQPLLPTTTTCMLCEKLIDRFREDLNNIMYECEICFEIFHVECAKVIVKT